MLSIHYNGSNSFVFANTTKTYLVKGKNSEIKDYTLCLCSISKDFTVNSMKKNWIKKKCNIFSADFNPIDSNIVLDIHKYLMKAK